MRFRRLILKIDSEVVFKSIWERHADLGWNQRILSDIQWILDQNWPVIIMHTFSEGNIRVNWFMNETSHQATVFHRLEAAVFILW